MVDTHADDGIMFQILSGKDEFVGESKFDTSLLQATGGGSSGGAHSDTVSKLSKVS